MSLNGKGPFCRSQKRLPQSLGLAFYPCSLFLRSVTRTPAILPFSSSVVRRALAVSREVWSPVPQAGLPHPACPGLAAIHGLNFSLLPSWPRQRYTAQPQIRLSLASSTEFFTGVSVSPPLLTPLKEKRGRLLLRLGLPHPSQRALPLSLGLYPWSSTLYWLLPIGPDPSVPCPYQSVRLVTRTVLGL